MAESNLVDKASNVEDIKSLLDGASELFGNGRPNPSNVSFYNDAYGNEAIMSTTTRRKIYQHL